MKKAYLFLICSMMPLMMLGQYFNVNDYGAIGNHTLCTEAFQKAIDTASDRGGGKVIVPAGDYVSGPLFLRSNIEFEVCSGATIYFSNDIANTPIINGSWEGIERKVYASLFTGHDLKNVTITGRGRIDGQGKAWWDAFWETDKMRTAAGIREREPENPEGSPLKYPRPRMINLYRCENVKIADLTITNSPSWTVHPVYCRNVIIDGISIIQPYESPNTDGIDPDCCNGVRISNCYIDCGDDCITLKSGYNEHGRKKGIPCENIVISNCTFAHGRSAVGIGSEMSGGIKNVTVMNCVFKGTLRGLCVKTGRGRGGTVENIFASGIIMENLREGISIDMGYEGVSGKIYPVTESTPFFKNIRFKDIIGTNVEQAINIIGLAEAPPQFIVLEDIRMVCKRGLEANYVKNLTLRNIELLNVNEKSSFNITCGNQIVLDNLIGNVTSKDAPVVDVFRTDGVLLRNCVMPMLGKNKFINLKECSNVKYVGNLFCE